MLGAPDEVGGALVFITARPEDFVPEPVHGQPVVGITVVYVGPVERAVGRVYLNYIGDEGLGRVEAAFGPECYARLQALKGHRR